MADQPEKLISLQDFLENHAPGHWESVSDLADMVSGHWILSTPRLKLYCDNEKCSGFRFFSWSGSNPVSLQHNKARPYFLEYMCSNCSEKSKIFAAIVILNILKPEDGRIYKIGEFPAFGPPIPAKAISLVAPDRDLFLTGRRAESQGMGIGAFVYYRRVVENQKDRIFDEIIRVARILNPNDPVIEELEKAKEETQFTKAVDVVKKGLPQSIYINGHNPLTLLHSALSQGVHEHTDTVCLELATSIRTVLIELALGLGQALKDDAEVQSAVKRLAKSKKHTDKS